VAAGSNTSTVTLQVVGGDKKGSLKSETVKYGHESQGTGEGQQHIQKTDPFSRERKPPKNKTVTVKE
jgi:predicted pyridoxine 5'-phosphate oxidase superfamily flavin-nucleotide-binding protein